jgi:hypothetical protein
MHLYGFYQNRAALFKVPSNLGDHERTINRPWVNLPLGERWSHIGMKRAIPEVTWGKGGYHGGICE